MALALRRNLGRYDWQNLVRGTPAAVVFGAGFWDSAPPAAALSLSADAGAVVLSGQAATLLRQRAAGASPGALTISGQAAGGVRSRLAAADAGALGIVGQAASGARGRAASADPGVISLNGLAASLTAARQAGAQVGAVSLAGQDASLTVSRLLTAAGQGISIAGMDATLDVLHNYGLSADAALIAVLGADAGLLYTPIPRTTGRRLVELSRLASGTALDHLLAIVLGTGTGRTLFASQYVVRVDEEEITLVRRETSQDHVQQVAISEVRQSHSGRRVFVHDKRVSEYTAIQVEHLFALIKRGSSISHLSHPETFTRSKQRTVSSF